LSLLVIAGLVDVVRRSYFLFTQQTDPIRNTIIFLVEAGALFWIISILRSRKYRYRKPQFKLILITVIAISLVCAFAGIEPLSSYKDGVFTYVHNVMEEWEAAREAEVIEEIDKLMLEKEKLEAEIEALKTEKEVLVERRNEAEKLFELEKETFRLVNMARQEQGFVSPTEWDNELYQLSKAHTQGMAERGEIFHSKSDAYAENCWQGEGFHPYEVEELAATIVDCWLSSPLHRAWLLHEPIKHSVVSIEVRPDGQFASWTFWMSETGNGPELVKRVAEEWETETGRLIPWIDWLYMKGYLKERITFK